MDKSFNIFDKALVFIQNVYNKQERWGSRFGKSYFGWGFVILVCFCIIFILNYLTPLAADDFGYLYIHAEDIKVTSVSDIVRSQINHYYLWGGRSVVHFIAQALLLLPPVLIDIFNSLVYLAYVFLIYFHIVGRGKHSISLFVLINLVIWLMFPAYGDTILWTTGSANYLWGTAIVLLLLLPYRLYQGRTMKLGKQILASLCLFVGGVLAGWTNENTAAAMLLAILLFGIYYRSKGWKIPVWGIAGLLGGLVGYIIMIAAPGNMVRAGDAVIASTFLVAYRFFNYTLTLFSNYGVFNLFYLIFLVLFWHFSKSSRTELLKSTLIYFVVFLAAIYSMLFSPSFPSRAWFGPLTFNVIACGIVFYNLGSNHRFIRQIRSAILLVLFVMFSFSFYDAIRDIYDFYKISESREIMVKDAKRKGLKVCEFERYKAKTKFTHTEEPTSNFMMKGYYGLDIKFKEE